MSTKIFEGEKWSGQTGPVDCFGKATIGYDSIIDALGEEHFIELDPSRTASGTERFWAYKVEVDTALVFLYSDVVETLYVGSNKVLENPLSLIEDSLGIILEKTHGRLFN